MLLLTSSLRAHPRTKIRFARILDFLSPNLMISMFAGMPVMRHAKEKRLVVRLTVEMLML